MLQALPFGSSQSKSETIPRAECETESFEHHNTIDRQVLGSRFVGKVKKLFILEQDLQSKDLPNTRIQPDRRWFGNTRVVGQKQLEQFREQMSSKVNIA